MQKTMFVRDDKDKEVIAAFERHMRDNGVYRGEFTAYSDYAETHIETSGLYDAGDKLLNLPLFDVSGETYTIDSAMQLLYDASHEAEGIYYIFLQDGKGIQVVEAGHVWLTEPELEYDMHSTLNGKYLYNIDTDTGQAQLGYYNSDSFAPYTLSFFVPKGTGVGGRDTFSGINDVSLIVQDEDQWRTLGSYIGSEEYSMKSDWCDLVDILLNSKKAQYWRDGLDSCGINIWGIHDRNGNNLWKYNLDTNKVLKNELPMYHILSRKVSDKMFGNIEHIERFAEGDWEHRYSSNSYRALLREFEVENAGCVTIISYNTAGETAICQRYDSSLEIAAPIAMSPLENITLYTKKVELGLLDELTEKYAAKVDTSKRFQFWIFIDTLQALREHLEAFEYAEEYYGKNAHRIEFVVESEYNDDGGTDLIVQDELVYDKDGNKIKFVISPAFPELWDSLLKQYAKEFPHDILPNKLEEDDEFMQWAMIIVQDWQYQARHDIGLSGKCTYFDKSHQDTLLSQEIDGKTFDFRDMDIFVSDTRDGS